MVFVKIVLYFGDTARSSNIGKWMNLFILFISFRCEISLFLSLKIRIKSNRFSFAPVYHESNALCGLTRAIFSMTKISHPWFMFIWFSVSRHNDLFRFNLHYNEPTAGNVPLRYVPGDMRGCDNCWSKYWSYGWRLVRCGGKSNFFVNAMMMTSAIFIWCALFS